jgi:hypothetical protein
MVGDHRSGGRRVSSKARGNRQRVRHEFRPAGTPPMTPPGGWPAAGSGYEPDPFSPAGSWVQVSRLIGAARGRARWFTIPLVVVVLALVVLSLLPLR